MVLPEIKKERQSAETDVHELKTVARWFGVSLLYHRLPKKSRAYLGRKGKTMTFEQFMENHNFWDWLDLIDGENEDPEDEDDDRLMDDLVCYHCGSVPKKSQLGLACEDANGEWFFFCKDCVDRFHRDGTFDWRTKEYRNIEPMWYTDFLEDKKGVKVRERHGYLYIVAEGEPQWI